MSSLLVEADGRVAVLSLNRPEKLNALSAQLLEELSDALWALDADPNISVILLQGKGRAFSAGNDLEVTKMDPSLRQRSEFDDDVWWLERSQRLRMVLWDMHKPVIAKVHGYCLAGATDLVLLADMIVAAEDAVIGFPPVRAQGSPVSHMWTYLVGPQWAKRLLLSGDTLTGAEAASIGLVMKAVPQAELDAEVHALAHRIALVPPDLVSANKRVVNLSMELMGARTMQRLAAETDARGHLSPAAIEFRRIASQDGIKAAVAWRDTRFRAGSGPLLRSDPGDIS